MLSFVRKIESAAAQTDALVLLPLAASPPGVEFSGVIADAGSSGGKWQTGQEVFGLAYGGAYAEYIAVSKDMVLAKPAHLSHVEAAGILECFITAYQALFLVGGFKRGESVLVHAGAGGVGVALNQMARAFGAEHVFTTAGSKEKLDVLDRLHFKPTRGICYKDESFADVVKAESKGVDVVRLFAVFALARRARCSDDAPSLARRPVLARRSLTSSARITLRPTSTRSGRRAGSSCSASSRAQRSRPRSPKSSTTGSRSRGRRCARASSRTRST